MTIISQYVNSNTQCLIMGDDKGPLSKPIFVGTEQNNGIYTTMFWTGLGLILVETDDDYVSADDYFRLG